MLEESCAVMILHCQSLEHLNMCGPPVTGEMREVFFLYFNIQQNFRNLEIEFSHLKASM